MSLRLARVNELVKREIGNYLSTRYGAETVRWTITTVDVAADLVVYLNGFLQVDSTQVYGKI